MPRPRSLGAGAFQIGSARLVPLPGVCCRLTWQRTRTRARASQHGKGHRARAGGFHVRLQRMFGRLFGAEKKASEPVASIKHADFGQLVWDVENKHWRTEVEYRSRRIPMYIPGKPPDYVADQACQKLLPVFRAPQPTFDTATEFLIAGLSEQARRPVSEAELLLEDVIVFAESEEGFHVCFQWREQPDWLLRVFFKDGHPKNWAFDD